MGFDLANLESADEGVPVTILHPATNQPLRDDDGNDVTITVMGQDSQAFQQAKRRAMNRRMAAMRGGRGAKLTAEELEAENIATLVACTVGWSGLALEGKPLTFDAKNVRMVYERFPWIREQVDEFIGDRANFLMTSSQSS